MLPKIVVLLFIFTLTYAHENMRNSEFGFLKDQYKEDRNFLFYYRNSSLSRS